MRVYRLPAIATLACFLASIASASTPRGDDLRVDGVGVRALGFKLSGELLNQANEIKAEVVKAGKFGYTGTDPDGIFVDLEIREETLFVTAISISGGDGVYAVKPEKISTGIIKKPVPAIWFTGTLSISSGSSFDLHAGKSGSHFKFENGKLTEQTQSHSTPPTLPKLPPGKSGTHQAEDQMIRDTEEHTRKKSIDQIIREAQKRISVTTHSQ